MKRHAFRVLLFRGTQCQYRTVLAADHLDARKRVKVPAGFSIFSISPPPPR